MINETEECKHGWPVMERECPACKCEERQACWVSLCALAIIAIVSVASILLSI